MKMSCGEFDGNFEVIWFKLTTQNKSIEIGQMIKAVNIKSLGQECPYIISLEHEHLIANGTYAKVCKAFNQNNTEEKLVAKTFELGDSQRFLDASKELKIAADLPNHSNLVDYKKTKLTEKNIYIVMELGQSNLKKEIMEKGSYSEQEVWTFLSQFCEGYKILMKHSIVHRDIKPENILIGFDGQYKITDYGLGEIVNLMKEKGMVAGKEQNCAPELLEENPKDKISSINDVYSLGVTVFEMCFKRLPYFGTKNNFAEGRKFITFLNSKLKLPKKNPYSHSLTSLILSMLEINENKRCTWEYIFFTVMGKSTQNFMPLSLQSKSAQRFSNHQISAFLLKNLSNLNTNLSQYLENESISIIDHIYADVIAKRQIIAFCDRLQRRLETINLSLEDKLFGEFTFNLLKIIAFLGEDLFNYFGEFYEKLNQIGFMEIGQNGDKYTQICTLINQDYESFQKKLKEAEKNLYENNKENHQKNLFKNEKQNGEKSSISKYKNKSMLDIEIFVYGNCDKLMEFLYNHHNYEECIQVGELEKWLEDKNSGVLGNFRKNESYSNHFDHLMSNVSKEKMNELISPIYLSTFAQLDKLNEQQHLLKCL